MKISNWYIKYHPRELKIPITRPRLEVIHKNFLKRFKFVSNY